MEESDSQPGSAPNDDATRAASLDSDSALSGKKANNWREYEWHWVPPFALVHVLAVVGLWRGADRSAWICCAVLYLVRAFAVTAGYHRYFSHRSFRTSRVAQFILAFVAQTSMQRGAIWWAYVHRHHHRKSDEVSDMHSPKQHGFVHSHIGWIFDRNRVTDYSKVPDLAKFPELVVLNKLWFAPSVALLLVVWGIFGFDGMCIGFCLSTVLVCHATFSVNSIAHVVGSRRYSTGDTSGNHWFLNLLTLGDGWHNNHHRYPSRCRAGITWWEFDPSYWILRGLSFVGIVWDIKEVRTGPGDRAGEIRSAADESTLAG
jgi:stearoyl-CoA desaturase (delta-9 desaturase)